MLPRAPIREEVNGGCRAAKKNGKVIEKVSGVDVDGESGHVFVDEEG